MVLLVRPTNQLPSVREQDYRPGNENGVNAGKAQSVIHLLPKAHTYAYSIELTLGVFTYSPTFKTPSLAPYCLPRDMRTTCICTVTQMVHSTPPAY